MPTTMVMVMTTIVEEDLWGKKARRWSGGFAWAWTALVPKNYNIGTTCVPLEYQLKFNVGTPFFVLEKKDTLNLMKIPRMKIFAGSEAKLRSPRRKSKRSSVVQLLPQETEKVLQNLESSATDWCQFHNSYCLKKKQHRSDIQSWLSS